MARRDRENLGKMIGIKDNIRRIRSTFGQDAALSQFASSNSSRPKPILFPPTNTHCLYLSLDVLASCLSQIPYTPLVMISICIRCLASHNCRLRRKYARNETGAVEEKEQPVCRGDPWVGRHGRTLFALRRRRSQEIRMSSVNECHQYRRQHVTHWTLDRGNSFPNSNSFGLNYRALYTYKNVVRPFWIAYYQSTTYSH